ncbi:tetratricopeptide repeat-containing sensor histidine kinase [Hugenholtzia roseola]|uniref:tetratricopeptide repeat-containing sensor histidine kinase n=1 Tax=Hugenholtzia roseola TaxID=1002 RepID=UPI0004259F74|nr:tetratricopeptide repeat protein [Hugenholtzia roseola]
MVVFISIHVYNLKTFCIQIMLMLFLFLSNSEPIYCQTPQKVSVPIPTALSETEKKQVQQYKEAAQERTQERDFRGASDLMNKVALIYWEHKQIHKAIAYFNHSLLLNENVANKSGQYGIYSNLAMLYSDLHLYDSSLYFFQKNLEGRRKNGNSETVLSSLLNIAVVQNNLKRYDEAATSLEEALSLAKERNDLEQIRSCYGMLAETYQRKGDLEKTQFYFNYYRTFHELVQQEKLKKLQTDSENQQKILLSEKEQTELALLQKELEARLRLVELEEKDSTIQDLAQNYTKSELARQILAQEKEIQAAHFAEKAAQKEAELSKQRNLTYSFLLTTLFLLVVAILIFFNMKEKKRNNKNLIAKNKQIAEQSAKLEALNQTKDRLFSIIAHDLKSPFHSLKGILALAQRGLFTQKEFESVLKELSTNVNVNLHLLENMLFWAKNQMQQATILPEKILPQEIMTHIKNKSKLFEKNLEDKKLTLKIKILLEESIWAERQVLALLLRNLLANAIKYAFEGSEIEIKVEKIEQKHKPMALFTVSNQGLGIEAKQKERLFLRLADSQQGTAGEKGTGLGLLLCHEFIQKNGGMIWVESQMLPEKQENGAEQTHLTKFYFTLPLLETET